MTWFKKNPKDQLRKQIRDRLKKLSFDELIEKSARLNEQFFQFVDNHLPQLKGKVVVSFCPFENEPQINIERNENHDPYKVAYVRIDDWKSRRMHAHLARRDLPGQWEEITPDVQIRVFQPIASQERCIEDDVALILTPGLAFGRTGERLGRGAGFYDRFLQKHPHALRMGIAFEEQIVESIPMDPHDEPIDILLTENEIVKRYAYDEWIKSGKIKNRQ